MHSGDLSPERNWGSTEGHEASQYRQLMSVQSYPLHDSRHSFSFVYIRVIWLHKNCLVTANISTLLFGFSFEPFWKFWNINSWRHVLHMSGDLWCSLRIIIDSKPAVWFHFAINAQILIYFVSAKGPQLFIISNGHGEDLTLCSVFIQIFFFPLAFLA